MYWTNLPFSVEYFVYHFLFFLLLSFFFWLLSVLRYTTFDSLFYIFKHFLNVFDSLTRKLIRPFCLKHAYAVISWGPSRSWSYGSCKSNYLCNQYLSPLTSWVRIPIRRGVFDTTLCDKVCQWLATDWWFSPASSTNKLTATV